MEIFYPANRFINFYIVPLLIGHRVADDKIDKGAVGRESFRDGASEQVGHAVILRDITESRRSAQETIESERLNALTLLAAGVAHEIGNPLNSLHINLQLMESGVQKLDDGGKADFQKSIVVDSTEVNRLESIVTP